MFTTMPPSMMQPMNAWTLKVVPVMKSMRMTPTEAKGTENMTTKGYRTDSYSEAMTM